MRGQFTMGRIDLEKAIAFAIQHAYERVRITLYREFHESGLAITPEQWIVLVLLWERDARTPSELSEATLRDRPTMTRIIDTMERNGLVTRKPASGDGRGRVVCLTREGRKLRAPLTARARRIVKRLERGIPEADLRVTRRTLTRIFENLA
jgi:DNA-binding MarR family transcriptional regulator